MMNNFFQKIKTKIPWKNPKDIVLVASGVVFILFLIVLWNQNIFIDDNTSTQPNDRNESINAEASRVANSPETAIEYEYSNLSKFKIPELKNKLVIIENADSFRVNWKYLFFEERPDISILTASSSNFLGSVELAALQKYQEPTYEIIRNGEKESWFVLKNIYMTGTGVFNQVDSWYKIDKSGVAKVLEFPIKGYVDWGMPFIREYTSRIIFQGESNGRYTVNVLFNVIYTNSHFFDDSDDLKNLDNIFSINKKVVYVWDENKKIFAVDDKKSEMTQGQIDGIFNDGNDGFVQHNFNELKKFASVKNAGNREWLKILLDRCADNEQTSALLKEINL